MTPSDLIPKKNNTFVALKATPDIFYYRGRLEIKLYMVRIKVLHSMCRYNHSWSTILGSTLFRFIFSSSFKWKFFFMKPSISIDSIIDVVYLIN